MLAVSIKIGSWVKIGPVYISFVERNGNWIKIGIKAPRELKIERLNGARALEETKKAP